MLASMIVLVFGRDGAMPPNGSFPAILAAEQTRFREPHPMFPLLETPLNSDESDHEASPILERRTGTSEPDFGGPKVPVFVPIGTPDHPQNDTPQDSLFVPLSQNRTED